LHVVKFYSVLPSVQLLMAIHHLAIVGQRDHIVFIFRQSNEVASETFIRKNCDKYISKARKLVGDRADTGKVNVKSVAVIANQNSRGRFLPSFTAIERIEVDHLTKSFDDEGYSIDYRDNMIGSLRLADIATNYITNQLLYAKLNGLRALVMMMGQNALCHNWTRESRFMRMYTVMYGRLEFAVCTPATEPKNNNRGVDKRDVPQHVEQVCSRIL